MLNIIDRSFGLLFVKNIFCLVLRKYLHHEWKCLSMYMNDNYHWTVLNSEPLDTNIIRMKSSIWFWLNFAQIVYFDVYGMKQMMIMPDVLTKIPSRIPFLFLDNSIKWFALEMWVYYCIWMRFSKVVIAQIYSLTTIIMIHTIWFDKDLTNI